MHPSASNESPSVLVWGRVVNTSEKRPQCVCFVYLCKLQMEALLSAFSGVFGFGFTLLICVHCEEKLQDI